MGFHVTRVRETGPVRYEKVGRLLPDGEGEVRLIKDGHGEILRIHRTDLTLLSAGLPPEGLRISESGNRIVITGPSGEEYTVLTRQVRGMMEEWGKKKAAVFVMREE